MMHARDREIQRLHNELELSFDEDEVFGALGAPPLICNDHQSVSLVNMSIIRAVTSLVPQQGAR